MGGVHALSPVRPAVGRSMQIFIPPPSSGSRSSLGLPVALHFGDAALRTRQYTSHRVFPLCRPLRAKRLSLLVLRMFANTASTIPSTSFLSYLRLPTTTFVRFAPAPSPELRGALLARTVCRQHIHVASVAILARRVNSLALGSAWLSEPS